MSRRKMFCSVCGEVSLGNAYCSNKCKQKAYRKRKAEQMKAQSRMIDIETYGMQQELINVFGDTTEFNLAQFYEDFGKDAYRRFVHITHGIFAAMREEILNAQ